MDSYYKWYDNDEDFKRYVDSYSKARELTVDIVIDYDTVEGTELIDKFKNSL